MERVFHAPWRRSKTLLLLLLFFGSDQKHYSTMITLHKNICSLRNIKPFSPFFPQFEKFSFFFFIFNCLLYHTISLAEQSDRRRAWLISHSQSAHQEFPQPFVKILSLEKNKCSRSQFETAIWTVQVRTFLFYSHGNSGSFSFLTSGYAFRLTINLWVFLNFEKWLLGWQEMKCPCIPVLWFIDSLVASLIVVIWYVF